MFSHAIILGAAGGFGRLFTTLLQRHDIPLVRFDLAGSPDMPPEDIVRPSARLIQQLGRCDLLLLCVPEKALMPTYLTMCGYLPAGALVVDIASVKTGIAALAQRAGEGVELLSVEPMFAPDVGLEGENIVAVPLRSGPRSAAFLALLATAGARITQMDALRHDRMAAAAQVAVHAALLAYGIAFGKLGCAPQDPTTPLQRKALGLLARILSRDPAVYWHIQRDNPFGAAARAAVCDGLALLDRLVTEGDEAGFEAMFEQCGDIFDRDLASVADETARNINEPD